MDIIVVEFLKYNFSFLIITSGVYFIVKLIKTGAR